MTYYFRYPESVHCWFFLFHGYSQTEAELLSKQAKDYWKGEPLGHTDLPLFIPQVTNQTILF